MLRWNSSFHPLTYRRHRAADQSDFDRLSSTLSGRWSQRDVNGGFRGPAVIRARVLPVKSSAAGRVTTNFIASEWRLTRRPYDLLAFDPSPTLENRKLDTVVPPL